MKSAFASFLIAVDELLRETSQRIKLNPLYAIPYIFLIAVILFVLILNFAVYVLQLDGLPK
jgi:Ni,Fe-hydrogenase I cytochrome b subunit